MSEWPAMPCECGHLGEPELDVRRLSPVTDELRFICTACRETMLTVVLGAEPEVDARGRELGGEQVHVTMPPEVRS